MVNSNSGNERLKRRYLGYLREAKGQSEPTVVATAKALDRFESSTKRVDFGKFRIEQAIAFKRRLAEQQNHRGSGKLSKATLHATLGQVKAFFIWLAGQQGFRAVLTHSDMAYFNLSDKDVRIATAHRPRTGPTLDQIQHVIALMPSNTPVEQRDRAVVVFTLLTGARDSATASILLKHVDLAAGSVYQDARHVRTKFSKSFVTYFAPIDDGLMAMLKEWVDYLRTKLLWGPEDPLFPATRIQPNAQQRFEVAGFERKPWRSAAAIRRIFKVACARAGLPYFNPHSLRHTLVRFVQSICGSPEDFKAWSQNLGHEDVLTTLTSYGTVSTHRQGEIIRRLGKAHAGSGTDADILEAAARIVRKSQGRGPSP